MQYIYQADVWCEACGLQIMEDIIKSGEAPEDYEDETTYDSDEFPKGPFDSEESDCPEHCGAGEECLGAEELPDGTKVGQYLGTGLTSEGVAYVLDKMRDYVVYCSEPSYVVDMWAEDLGNYGLETEEETLLEIYWECRRQRGDFHG